MADWAAVGGRQMPVKRDRRWFGIVFFQPLKEESIMDFTRIIEPERHGLWIVAACVMALAALGVGLSALARIDNVVYHTQAQVLMLNQKVESLKNQLESSKAAQPQQAAPAPAPK